MHTEVWRPVEPMVSKVPPVATFDFTTISFKECRVSIQGLLFVHPNNKPVRKDLANVP